MNHSSSIERSHVGYIIHSTSHHMQQETRLALKQQQKVLTKSLVLFVHFCFNMFLLIHLIYNINV